MQLVHECRTVATHVYAGYSKMFPQRLLALSLPDLTLAKAPLHLKICALQHQLEILESMDALRFSVLECLVEARGRPAFFGCLRPAESRADSRILLSAPTASPCTAVSM